MNVNGGGDELFSWRDLSFAIQQSYFDSSAKFSDSMAAPFLRIFLDLQKLGSHNLDPVHLPKAQSSK